MAFLRDVAVLRRVDLTNANVPIRCDSEEDASDGDGITRVSV